MHLRGLHSIYVYRYIYYVHLQNSSYLHSVTWYNDLFSHVAVIQYMKLNWFILLLAGKLPFCTSQSKESHSKPYISTRKVELRVWSMCNEHRALIAAFGKEFLWMHFVPCNAIMWHVDLLFILLSYYSFNKTELVHLLLLSR